MVKDDPRIQNRIHELIGVFACGSESQLLCLGIRVFLGSAPG